MVQESASVAGMFHCMIKHDHRSAMLYRSSMLPRGTVRSAIAMKTSGELVSLLPGKLEIEGPTNGRHLVAAVFTWGGKTTSRWALEENQTFELLCFKPFGGA